MSLRRTVISTNEPVDLEAVKLHLRVDHSEEDSLIARLITVAREICERRLRRTLVASEWTLTLDRFDELEALRRPPITAVRSIRYLDSTLAWQTLDISQFDTDLTADDPVRLMPITAWPAAAERMSAVEVVYLAGYADATSVPEPIKQWMLLAIGAMYESREALSDDFPDMLIWDYKVWG